MLARFSNSNYSMKLLLYPLMSGEVITRHDIKLWIKPQLQINCVRINRVKPVMTICYLQRIFQLIISVVLLLNTLPTPLFFMLNLVNHFLFTEYFGLCYINSVAINYVDSKRCLFREIQWNGRVLWVFIMEVSVSVMGFICGINLEYCNNDLWKVNGLLKSNMMYKYLLFTPSKRRIGID